MIKVKEFIRNFQNNSLLQGVERVVLLQKVVAGAIAYAAPCFNGSIGEMGTHYRNTVLSSSISVITDVNELFIVNTDAIMHDVKLLWEGRYECLNFPEHSTKTEQFHNSLSEGTTDISNKYNYWVRQLTPVVTSYFQQSGDF